MLNLVGGERVMKRAHSDEDIEPDVPLEYKFEYLPHEIIRAIYLTEPLNPIDIVLGGLVCKEFKRALKEILPKDIKYYNGLNFYSICIRHGFKYSFLEKISEFLKLPLDRESLFLDALEFKNFEVQRITKFERTAKDTQENTFWKYGGRAAGRSGNRWIADNFFTVQSNLIDLFTGIGVSGNAEYFETILKKKADPQCASHIDISKVIMSDSIGLFELYTKYFHTHLYDWVLEAVMAGSENILKCLAGIIHKKQDFDGALNDFVNYKIRIKPNSHIPYLKGSFWDRYSKFLPKNKINLFDLMRENIIDIDHLETILEIKESDIIFY